MYAVCSHAKCILGIYSVSDMTVKCPCHSAKFDLMSGTMTEPPFVAPNAPNKEVGLKKYRIREADIFRTRILNEANNLLHQICFLFIQINVARKEINDT